MRSAFSVLLSLGLLPACGSCDDGSSAPTDVGVHDLGATDAGGDAGSDAGGDAGNDAGTDSGIVTCPVAPAGADAEQIAAIDAVNDARRAMGVPCATMVATVNQAASAHCAYYTANGSLSSCLVMGNPHSEVSGCAGFTGASFATRMTAAGYAGQPRFEDMAFADDGATAVRMWIDSVWHRTPVLSPWVRDLGYGHSAGCDTMDFGVGATTPSSFVATYPYAGQVDVPRSFDGSREGPEPPMPPSGWPSGYPVTLYLRGVSPANQATMVHTLRVDGSGSDLPHQWITPESSTFGLLSDEYVLYADAPLTAATTYRVHVEGTTATGVATFDFTFTTR